MVETEQPDTSIDWALTTWEGSRREALRRWSRMPLERVIAALEEMAEISRLFEHTHAEEPTSNLIGDQREHLTPLGGHKSGKN